MDTTAIILKVIEIIPRFIPRSKPPKIDYSPLYEAIPRYEVPKLLSIEAKVQPTVRTKPVEVSPEVQPQEVSTGCIPCSRSHLSTVSGALGEATRFAREKQGIRHPEVQRRIMLSEDEISIMERIDLAPDALAASPPEERQLAEEYLPRIRVLRQSLGQITSLEKLEEIAAEASVLSQEFRLRHLQLRGIDLNPVLELARRVQAGEITMEEAKGKLKEILPEEEL